MTYVHKWLAHEDNPARLLGIYSSFLDDSLFMIFECFIDHFQ